MSSAATTTSVRAILKGPDDWIPWLEMVKSTATTGQIWEYVNPSKKADEIPSLTEPTWPEPSSLPRSQEEIASGILTTAHKEDLSEHRSLYKLQLNRYDQRKASLAHLHRFIQETVHPDHIHHTFECDTVQEMLVNLQKRLKPKDDVRRLQLTDQYRELQKSPKSNDLNAWMTNWEKVYREGVKLTQPIVQKDTAVQDFLRAVFDIAPDFASFWTNTIQSVDNENAKPDLYTIIDRFRVQRQILRVETAESSSRSAYPTSLQEQQQGQQQGQQEEIQEKAPKKTDCLCGEPHRFKDCPYLIPGRQPQGWKPDPAIQERIETKMQNPRLKAAVDHARASQKEKGIPEEDIFGEVTF
jgi:hypothetical protein